MVSLINRLTFSLMLMVSIVSYAFIELANVKTMNNAAQRLGL